MSDEDFDIDRLAGYLHLLPAQISKLADRGKLPGRKVTGKWRFSQAEIHHWLEHRIGVSNEDQLAEMEGLLQRVAPPARNEPITLSALLPIEAIAVPLPARTRSSVIAEMTKLAAVTGLLWNPEKMARAVQSREAMQPTALDNGVALLHPRRPIPNILGQAHLALGITAGGIPFGGRRGRRTDVFFLICSEDDPGHLRILARLSRLISDEDFLTAIREAQSPSTLHELIAERDEDLGVRGDS